jgi:hypothetical protein
MRRNKIEGKCHICGIEGPLTFEHTPPRAAFNNKRVITFSFEEAMKLGPDEISRGKIQQKGMGSYTFCGKCNNNTGQWYGVKFADWCYQGMDILIKSKGKPSLFYFHYIFPLAVIKQIVVMFFSGNNYGFNNANPELVEFILNKKKRFLHPKYRFFVYYNIEGKLRTGGLTAKCDASGAHEPIIMSEINFPPFGYLMTLNSQPPDNRLCEISHFARYSYDEFVRFSFKLPVLPTHLLVPGDYRNKEEIKRQMEDSKKIEERGQTKDKHSKP